MDRLFDHLHKWAVGLHTVWKLEDEPGIGLSRYDTLGDHKPFWFPMDELHPTKEEQVEILTWLCDRLCYTYCAVEENQARLLEGELIDRLKGRYRLANATGAAKTARHELGGSYDLTPYRDCLAKGHSMWSKIDDL